MRALSSAAAKLLDRRTEMTAPVGIPCRVPKLRQRLEDVRERGLVQIHRLLELGEREAGPFGNETQDAVGLGENLDHGVVTR
jgi:hypothetical protein